MNELYTVNYKDEGPFFLSNFGQITRCVRIHGVHNEEAIDRNTEAIIEQTEMQHSESDESQIQFSGHSMMLERESNETQNIMTAHTKMMKDESDETQNIMTAHTKMMKDESDETQNIMTAHTKMMKDESDETQEILQSGYADVKNALTAHTNTMKNTMSATTETLRNEINLAIEELVRLKQEVKGLDNKQKLDDIKSAIQGLHLVVNNYVN